MANQLEEVVAVPADAAESSVPPEDTKTPESLQRKQLQNILARLKLKQFKSNGQAKLVQEVVFGKTSVLGVLPTGGGKTLAMFACLGDAFRPFALFSFSKALKLKIPMEQQQKEPNLIYIKISFQNGRSPSQKFSTCQLTLLLRLTKL